MKTAYSNTLIATALATTLLIAPPPIEAEIFGYAGIKGGYAYQQVDRIELKNRNAITGGGGADGAFFNPFSQSSIPVGANLGLGYFFTPRFGIRLEAEYTYRLGLKQTVPSWSLNKNNGQFPPFDPNAKVSIHSQSILGNLYLDYYVTPSVSLYLSAGAGASLFNAMFDVGANLNHGGPGKTKDNSKTSSTSFAWQAGLGVAYALMENLWLDLNVRYINLGTFKSTLDIQPTPQNAESTSKTTAFESLLGVNYRF